MKINQNICFVVLNYRDAVRTVSQVNRCINFNLFSHIVIVDNCSEDGSIDYFKRHLPSDVDIVKSNENGGFARGNNIGAKYAVEHYSPDYILFANPDISFSLDSLLECLHEMETRKELGLISLRMLDEKGDEGIGAWKYRSFNEYLLSNFWLYRHFHYNGDWRYHDFCKHFQYVDMVRGSFMFFRTDALVSANYFDPDTFLYYEEEIISFKLKKLGFNVGLITDAFYTHCQADDSIQLRRNWDLYVYYDKSLLIFLKKYMRINSFQQIVFRILSIYSHVELRFIDYLHYIFHRS